MTASETASLAGEQSPARATAEDVRSTVPVLIVAGGAVVAIVSARGGYFPTSWGLGATLLLWATGLWLVVSGRTDAGRGDALFLGLLGALTFWIGLSIVWSDVPAQSVLELERTLLVLAGVAAVLVLARRQHVPRLGGTLLAAIALVSAYALATRLFPDRLGRYDPIAGYRLSDPLGYWNSLGIFAAMGALLAIGVAADATGRWARATAAASVVVLTTTLYFTYSRGSWLALGLGLCVLLAVTPRRLRTIGVAVAVGAPAAVGVLLASSSRALTHQDASLAQSTREGHRLALLLLALCAAAAGISLLLDVLRRTVVFPRRIQIALGSVLLAAALAAPVGVVVREGGPVAIARHAWDAFGKTGGPETGGDLDKRLFSFAGNGRVDLWRAARDLLSENRLVGSGAGTFERYWQSREDASFKVRDAHSLYVEAFAELGPPGLLLLVATLLVPVGAGLLVRRNPLLPAALAAYVAFLIHAGVDWDWELSGVTLTALLVGSLAVIATRTSRPHMLGSGLRVVGCVAASVASIAMIVAFLGNGALNRAEESVASKSYANAVGEANRAHRLMPWSPWPLIIRGDAELAAAEPDAAAVSYRRAIDVDSGEWRAWLGLAAATHGKARAAALARARRLYPRSAEIAQAAALLEDETNG